MKSFSQDKSMLIVSLTGGIGCGKSIAAEVLESLGCYIHRADKIAHQLMEPQKPAWKKIVSHFGLHILNPDKSINRQKLSSVVFSDPKEREYLNSLIHPLVLKKKKQVIDKLEKEGKYKIFVSEAALTIEAGYTDFFDKIIVVYCEESLQIKRLMERDGISQKEALKKIKSQMSTQEKVKYADYIIDTAGPIQYTVEQTERVYRSLLLDYRLKQKSRKERKA